MLRLTELNPKWWAEAERHGQGVLFDCPCERCQASGKPSRLAVSFANPLDGGGPFPIHGSPRRLYEALNPEQKRTEIVPPGFLWIREGDSFEELSLHPSVDCSASGHWHGFLKNGDIT